MFTLFHLLVLAGIGFGLALGASVGSKLFGIVGGIIGAALGVYLGFVVGRIPEMLVLRLVVRDFRPKSSEELRAHLHSPNCLTPNLVLLELRSRGENIRRELPVVVDLLTSEDVGRRGHGWAALTSAFPELVEKIHGYSVGDTVDECRRKTELLRQMAYQSDAANSG